MKKAELLITTHDIKTMLGLSEEVFISHVENLDDHSGIVVNLFASDAVEEDYFVDAHLYPRVIGLPKKTGAEEAGESLVKLIAGIADSTTKKTYERLSVLETSLTMLSNSISAKAEKSEVDTLSSSMTYINNNLIANKVSQCPTDCNKDQ